MENKPKHKRPRWSMDDTELTLLSLPTTIWYVLFCFLPIAGIIMAFKNFRIVVPGQNFFYNLFASDWTGLKNFEFLFT